MNPAELDIVWNSNLAVVIKWSFLQHWLAINKELGAAFIRYYNLNWTQKWFFSTQKRWRRSRTQWTASACRIFHQHAIEQVLHQSKLVANAFVLTRPRSSLEISNARCVAASDVASLTQQSENGDVPMVNVVFFVWNSSPSDPSLFTRKSLPLARENISTYVFLSFILCN